MCLRNVERWHR